MNRGYAKLFNSIVTSSVWSEDDKTRIMWVTLLACADATGHVAGSIPGMAALARMSTEDAERAITKLAEPDPYSRTKDHEGRRLIAAEGGWLLVNYAKYRESRDPEKRREQNRDAQQRWRSKQRKRPVSDRKQRVKRDNQNRESAASENEPENAADGPKNADSDRKPQISQNKPASAQAKVKSKGILDLNQDLGKATLKACREILKPTNKSQLTGLKNRIQWAASVSDATCQAAIDRARTAVENANEHGTPIPYWYTLMLELGYSETSENKNPKKLSRGTCERIGKLVPKTNSGRLAVIARAFGIEPTPDCIVSNKAMSWFSSPKYKPRIDPNCIRCHRARRPAQIGVNTEDVVYCICESCVTGAKA